MQHVKQRKFLIASHGTMASGVRSSLELIIGNTEDLFVIEAYVSENRPVDEEVEEILKKLNSEDELIIFTDLLGGSVTNQMAKFTMQHHVHLVSGFNLPLLIEIMLADPDSSVSEIIHAAIIKAREQIVYVNELIDSTKKVSHND